MAPIRRYLRITKYSVLECHIYLDNPALAQPWLLNPRNPVLPRVIKSVRPLVLPKLREERERSRKKSTKKRRIKDVVVEDDFEVSIFLTETNTRHSILYKHRHFRDTTQAKLTSNSQQLTGVSREEAIPIDEQAHGAAVAPLVLRQEDDDDVMLRDIPTLGQVLTMPPPGPPPAMRKSKRRHGTAETISRDQDGDIQSGADLLHSDDSGDNSLFVSDEGNDEGSDKGSDRGSDASLVAAAAPPAKRRKDNAGGSVHHHASDDKKKLAADISYEGFSIFGRVLCLVVKKRDSKTSASARESASAKAARGKAGPSAAPGGQAVMENWITSTQVPESMTEEMLDPT